MRSLTERPESAQGTFLQLQVRLNVLMGGIEPLVAEPQRDGRHVDAGLEQVHRGGVADDVRRHALGGQARTSLASPLAGLIEQMGNPLPRQTVAACVTEGIVGRDLAAGYPIATGVIEGACRYLVRDRMELTGARWRLVGAEAVLKLRALRASGDFDAYWDFHEAREYERNHAQRYAERTAPPVSEPPPPPSPPRLGRVKSLLP